ncbi:calcium-binding protein [Streptomyces sp. A7024]|uniref:Calcium-binding protein n=1 Tax=Streptomyces coryli TaxID=1128680 RepID=A0A6G4UED9_9ACTN|nr:DUF5707 domain-containing protein [Streptomyces coryli]NGN69858.1 calcium-binding protein [Streptomyces coryli]
MRKIAIGAGVAGVLALGALALPAAQADPESGLEHKRNSAGLFGDKPGARALAAEDGATQITDVTVNGGKYIAVGTTKQVSFTASVTATNPDGIADGQVAIWHGSDDADPEQVFGPTTENGTCTAVNATTSTCKVTITVTPHDDTYAYLWNELAGTWHVAAYAAGNDGSETADNFAGTTRVQRYSKLTVNAAPEPVTKGKPVTITGKLTRANWDDFAYHGYTNQPVALQFKPKTSTSYSTLKTPITSSTGALKTTSTAKADGYWRWNFTPKATTTPAVKTYGDYVDVR